MQWQELNSKFRNTYKDLHETILIYIYKIPAFLHFKAISLNLKFTFLTLPIFPMLMCVFLKM